MIITISGTIGSGKSTVAKILAQKLNLKHHSIGDFMRELALERNLSLEDFGKIAEGDRSVDTTLDKKQIDLGGNEDNFIIDGRLSFHFIPKSIKIFLDGELKTRAERILRDILIKNIRKEEQAETIREMVEKIQTRKECEQLRYQKYYNIDPYDEKYYDLIVDTTSITPEEVANKIVEFVEKQQKLTDNFLRK